MIQLFSKKLLLALILLCPFIGNTQKYAHYDESIVSSRWVYYQMQIAELETFSKTIAKEKEEEIAVLRAGYKKAEESSDQYEMTKYQNAFSELDEKYVKKFNQKVNRTDSIVQLRLEKGLDSIRQVYDLDEIYMAPGNEILFGDVSFDITLELLAVLNGQSDFKQREKEFAAQKLVHVYTEKVYEQWGFYQNKKRKLDSITREMNWEYEDYEKLRNQFNNGLISAKKAKTDMEKSKSKIEELEATFNRMNAGFSENLQNKMQEALEFMNKTYGYDIIFDASANNPDDLQRGKDVSVQLIQLLNKS